MGDRLINLVSQHPVLYDKSRDDYIDTKMKDNIWAGIAHELQNSGNGSIATCKREC